MVKNKIVAVDQSSKKDGDSITWKDNEWKVIERSLSEIWVSDISGSDDNDGSQLNPFKTLTKAVESMLNSTGEVIIHVAPHGSEEGYDTSVFGVQRDWNCDKLKIVGDGYDIFETDLEFESYVSVPGEDPRNYTFLDGYFNVGEYDGYFLTKVGGPSGVAVGNSRLILKTETDRIYIPQRHYGLGYATPEVGDIFAVTKPSVKFNINFDDLTPGAFSDNRSASLYGGYGSINQAGYDSFIFSIQFKNVVQFENVEFKVPDGIPLNEFSYTNVYFIGAFEFFGCLFSCNYTTEDSTVSFIFDGVSQVGSPTEQEDPDYVQLGNGISFMSRGSGNSPFIELNDAVMIGSVFGSNMVLKRNSYYECTYGCSFKNTIDKDFSNVALFEGSKFVDRSERSGVFFHNDVAGYEVFLYESTFWVYGSIFHYGTAELASVQYNSIFHLGYSNIVNKSGTGNGVRIMYDSLMRIIHKDYSGMGDVELGDFPSSAITRTSGPWEIGEEWIGGGNRALRNS